MDDIFTLQAGGAASRDTSPQNEAALQTEIPSMTDAVNTAPEIETEDETSSLPGRHELATQMVAKLCHDFISPAGAIMSGLDLLEDPSAQDMKQEALNLISTSAKKLVALVYFARVAFGAATTSEAFSAAQLNKILNDVYASMRAELDFRIPPETVFEKPAARALLNLGLLIGNSLPMGGKARLEATTLDGTLTITADGRGPRARLKPEAVEALAGKPLSDGLAGQWIQPHWLHSVVSEAGGHITVEAETDALVLTVTMPAS
jgi:histidine phosphotransferase ChpT